MAIMAQRKEHCQADVIGAATQESITIHRNVNKI